MIAKDITSFQVTTRDHRWQQTITAITRKSYYCHIILKPLGNCDTYSEGQASAPRFFCPTCFAVTVHLHIDVKQSLCPWKCHTRTTLCTGKVLQITTYSARCCCSCCWCCYCCSCWRCQYRYSNCYCCFLYGTSTWHSNVQMHKASLERTHPRHRRQRDCWHCNAIRQWHCWSVGAIFTPILAYFWRHLSANPLHQFMFKRLVTAALHRLPFHHVTAVHQLTHQPKAQKLPLQCSATR